MTTRLLMANLWLAAFNLLPAFPMDGGRIFRSLLALRWNRQTSTLVASRVAQGFAAAFIFAGFYPAFGLNANVLLAFIGIFIWITAQGELNRDSHADSMRSA
jgi:stage IV sporulation protein FB